MFLQGIQPGYRRFAQELNKIVGIVGGCILLWFFHQLQEAHAKSTLYLRWIKLAGSISLPGCRYSGFSQIMRPSYYE